MRNGRWIIFSSHGSDRDKVFVADQPGSDNIVKQEIVNLVSPGMEDGDAIRIVEGLENKY